MDIAYTVAHIDQILIVDGQGHGMTVLEQIFALVVLFAVFGHQFFFLQRELKVLLRILKVKTVDAQVGIETGRDYKEGLRVDVNRQEGCRVDVGRVGNRTSEIHPFIILGIQFFFKKDTVDELLLLDSVHLDRTVRGGRKEVFVFLVPAQLVDQVFVALEVE